jgi:hypothetical protein
MWTGPANRVRATDRACIGTSRCGTYGSDEEGRLWLPSKEPGSTTTSIAHDGATDSIALILGRDRVGGNAQFSLRR